MKRKQGSKQKRQFDDYLNLTTKKRSCIFYMVKKGKQLFYKKKDKRRKPFFLLNVNGKKEGLN